jgi:hypothetical protein
MDTTDLLIYYLFYLLQSDVQQTTTIHIYTYF